MDYAGLTDEQLLGRVAEAIGRSLAPAAAHARAEPLSRIARVRVAPPVLFRGAHGSRAPPLAAGIAA